MAMPEATMDEHGHSVPWEHEVRPTGKLFRMEPVAKAQSMEMAPHDPLRLGISPAHP